jgi:hypothetical protein
MIAILIVGMLIMPAIADSKGEIGDQAEHGQPSGTPFDSLWNEIKNIKNSILDLHNQINNIQLIPGEKGDQGNQGEPGLKGDKGDQGLKGEPGTSGANGLACWDLNGNGIGDIAEDINSDGNYDTLDCKGSQGQAGADGQQGIQGIAGIPGISGYEIVYSNWRELGWVAGGGRIQIYTACPDGKTPINGGYETIWEGTIRLNINSNVPYDDGTQKGWLMDIYNPGDYPTTQIRGYAICANVQ